MKLINNIKQTLQTTLQNSMRDFLFPGLQQKSFEAAQVTNVYNEWATEIKAINKDIITGQERLVARARNGRNNDPYARKVLRVLRKNVVGPEGFILRNKAYDWVKEEGKFKKVFDMVANSKVQNGWYEWSKKKYCTASRQISFNEFCRLVIQTVATDGEMFFIKTPVDKNKNKFGFTLKPYSTEFVPLRLNMSLKNGNFIFMGIEFNKDLEPVNYYFKKSRIQDELNGPNYLSDYIPVPAKDVIHLFIKEEYFQVRGVTWLAPALVRMHMLNSYEEAILIKARVAANMPFILEKDMQAQQGKSPTLGLVGGQKDSQGNIVRAMRAGEPWLSPDGYKTSFPDAKTPSGQEGPYTKLILYDIAAGLDISGIELTGDYSEVNYTSSRTALLDSRETYKMLQEWFIEHFLIEVFEPWLEYALTWGAVVLPMAMYDKFNQPWFFGRRWQWVDPEKDVNAAIKAASFNLDTMENLLAERGLDYEDVMERRDFEIKDQKKREIYVDASLNIVVDATTPEEQPKPKNGKAKTVFTEN